MIFLAALFIIGIFLTIFQVIPYVVWTPTAEDKKQRQLNFSVQWPSWAVQLGNHNYTTVLCICDREVKTKLQQPGEGQYRETPAGIRHTPGSLQNVPRRD